MILTLLSAALAAAIILLVAQDWRRLERLPGLDAPAAPDDPPLISLLIPARNEERAIGRAVAGALAQRHRRIEVIVVDDGSTDGTAAALASLAGDRRLRVLAGRPLPAGWVGKCNACQQLSEAANGEWLLFLDADTAPGPELAAALLASATRRRLDLLTIFPFLELGSFWERLVLPPFLALITALFPFERMERADARPEQVLANGQCIFVRRAAYLAAGGHGAVRGEVLEDVMLARAIRAAGYRVGVAEGAAYLAVRMYTSRREVVAGLMKNAAAGYRSGGARSFWAMTRLILMAFGPLWLIAGGLIGSELAPGGAGGLIAASGGLALAACLSLWARIYRQRYRQPAAYGLLWPLGLLGYLLIAAGGFWRVLSGRGVIWKGRSYAG